MRGNMKIADILKAGFSKRQLRSYYYGDRSAKYNEAVKLAKFFGTDFIIWMSSTVKQIHKHNVKKRQAAVPVEIRQAFNGGRK